MHSLVEKKIAKGLPVVDAGPFLCAELQGDTAAAAACRDALAAELKDACHSAGMFYLIGHQIDSALLDRIMAETAAFFALGEDEKNAININKANNFRGYGILKNYRDWREQIHLGVEDAVEENKDRADAPRYRRLSGANQWPSAQSLPTFKETALAYFAAIDKVSRMILTLLAEALDFAPDYFTARMNDKPYLLMKAMSYLPQADAAGAQMGVTAHCDWSWLTFLIQDDVGGLEGQDLNGEWHKVDPVRNAIVVNTGELLEIETAGYLRASPHRVINARIDRQRFSIPVFINPALDAVIYPGSNFDSYSGNAASANKGEHVHKVIKPGQSLTPFVFGESEYDRKALGIWCYEDECVTALKK